MNFLLTKYFRRTNRHAVLGLGNLFFTGLIFTILWKIGHDYVPLWILAVLAHLAAITQIFFSQRKLIFKSDIKKSLSQYMRFQCIFLGLLGVGLMMLQALVAEGMCPLLAQILVLIVQTVIGFNFEWPIELCFYDIRLRHVITRLRQRAHGSGWVWLVFGVSLVVFVRYLVHPFYASFEYIGHDFSATATGLLEGRYWLQTNGFMAGLFNPPWFTPAWCSGAAFFADPQSAFYSPLQWLALVFDPFQAAAMNTLLFAAVAYWGSYLLARRVLRWQPAAAAVFAVLGMANAFLPMRSAVGEAGYQPLYLWPWIALALCWPSPDSAHWRSRIVAPALGVMLGLTGWLHFGFAGMMAPAFLAVLLLCLVLVFNGRESLKLLVARVMLGGVLAVALNISKLYEAASLMHNFPRDFYTMPGFASLRDALVAPLMALLLPSEWTAFFGMRRLSNVQFAVLPHEWALEFGLGALAVALLAAIALLWWQRRQVEQALAVSPNVNAYIRSLRGVQWLALLGCMLIGMLVPLLLWNQGAVRDGLKHIPILNSAAWPMRWIVIYLPVAQWLLALPLQRLLQYIPSKRQWLLVAAAAAGIWCGPVAAPVDYYLDPGIQSYDPKPVMRAYAQSTRTGQPIPIERVEASRTQALGLSRNDTMLDGASQAFCYNPIYGYRLEALPQKERLQSGPALAADTTGQSLIFNPACLVHPEANACKPGDGFRMNDPIQRQAAQDFVARRPFVWQRSGLGQALSWVSQGLFWLILTLLMISLWRGLLAAAAPLLPRS